MVFALAAAWFKDLHLHHINSERGDGKYCGASWQLAWQQLLDSALAGRVQMVGGSLIEGVDGVSSAAKLRGAIVAACTARCRLPW